VQGNSHGLQATVRAIAVQTNGQILIGGFFSEYGGLARSGIARLNIDGSVDPSFNPSYGQDTVFPMVVQPDGKILAGGYFSMSGLIVNFARLNANGSVDTTFSLGGNELVSAHVGGMTLQQDGKILMNGRFVFSGTNRDFLGVLRVNSDGSIDPDFVSTNTIAGYINSFVLQPDHKLIVGGRAASVAGINPGGITRLNPDGSFDATFSPRIGPEGDVFAIALQPAGAIIVGGSFSTVNGLPRYRLAQLNSDGSLVGSVEFNAPILMPDGGFRVTFKNSAPTNVIIEASSNLVDWTRVYTNTAPANPLSFIDTDAARFRQRFYRAVMKP